MASTDESNQEVIDGVLTRILFRSDDGLFAAGILRPSTGAQAIRVAGEIGQLEEGDSVRLIGAMKRDERFGLQFRVRASYPIMPHTEEGLIGYLSSGRIQSIGPKLAQRLVAYFGTDTLNIISESPHRLTEVEGIGQKRSKEIAEQVRDQVIHRDALIFLQGLELKASQANRIWNHYKEQTIACVRENPYRIAEEVSGIGFLTADQVAQKLGFELSSEIRAAAALIHVLTKAIDDGHVFLPEDVLIDAAIHLIGEQAPVGQELASLKAEGRLIDDHGVYLPFVHNLETELAERLTAMTRQVPNEVSHHISMVEHRVGLDLARHQRDAVELAATAPIMVLTGGPGTGKTTTVRAIVKVLSSAGEDVVLAAPTGRAARRLAEATHTSAATLHRLLGFHPVDGFRYNEDDPLPADAVIVDEASMLDQSLAVALLRALQPGARLILVGDAHQLPSVGAGNVLGDILASSAIPSVQLTEVFRQAQESEIVSSAYRILNGERPIPVEDTENSDFFVVPAETPDRAAELIETMVKSRIPRRFGLDPIDDIQVLAPMHRGVCGAHKLNERLQACLNPNGALLKRGTKQFRVGDKVMQIKNDYQKEVFNGDVGRVIAQTEGGIAIRFEKRVLEYDGEALDNVTLAYACSVHKSQGSEYPAIVLPVLTEHWLMLQRNLLYTAVTRGKNLVVLVGQSRAIARAVKNLDGVHRHTRLSDRLRAFA